MQDTYWGKCQEGKTEKDQVELEEPSDQSAGLTCLKETGKKAGVLELSSSFMQSGQSSCRLSWSPEAKVAHQRSLTSCRNGTASMWSQRSAMEQLRGSPWT